MMILDLIFASSFGLFLPEKQVYIYDDGVNKQYVCQPDDNSLVLQYGRWSGYGVLIIENCYFSFDDISSWPPVSLEEKEGMEYTLYDHSNNVIAEESGCRFVSSSDTGVNTGVIIDCRTY